MAGLTEVPHIIEDPENMRFEAHERNRVAVNALPETFVDHAEEIWGMLVEGKTQQVVADEMGWSRSKIADHALLEHLCPNCWELIVAQFQNEATKRITTEATVFVAPATITEKSLRALRPLTETHQLNIIQGLISGKIKNGQVKKLSKTFTERESFAERAIQGLIN